MKFALALVLLALSGCSSRSPDPTELVQSLANPEGVRAYSVLMGSREPAVLQAVGQGLQHHSARVRSQCVRLIAHQKDITWVPQLKALLSDPDRSVRTSSARCLVSMLDTAECLEVLRDQTLDPDTRILVIDGLLRDPLELCEPDLIQWLLSLEPDDFLTRVQDSQLSHWSPRLLRKLKDAELVRQLQENTRRLGEHYLQLWQTTSNPRLRLRSLNLFASYRGLESVPTLENLLSTNPDPWVRACCLNSLGWSRSPQALDRISAYLAEPRHPDEHRKLAIKGLAPLPDSPDRNQRLLSLARKESPQNREQIACTLGCSRDKTILPSLQSWLESETHEPTRRTLKSAIARISGRCEPCEPCR